MKNKFIILLLFSLLVLNKSGSAKEIYFESANIDIFDNGNIIKSSKGIAKSNDNNMNIFANQFNYNKNLSILKASGNAKAIFTNEGIKINADNFIYNKNLNTLKSVGNVIINDVSKNILLKSNEVFYDIEKKKISSVSNSTISDDLGNLFLVEKFVFSLNDNLIRLDSVKLNDVQKNITQLDKAYIDLTTKKLVGKDVSIEFSNENFDEDNEPRLKGNSISAHADESIVKGAVFTTCKKNDDCPPWQLEAKEIKHDKKKKIIYYKDAWLKLYDKPILYFPKFFHPDPTVKRQSGFLMPGFQSSTNTGTSFNVPYFYAISNNRDMTFKPRLYSNEKILLQSEYRVVNAKAKHTLDFSTMLESNQNSRNHFFSNSVKNIDFKNFDETTLSLQVQSVSNDTYLKSYKLKSPLIKNPGYLESSIGISAYKENFSFNTDFYAYETLSSKKSDRYEFVYPSYNLSKTLQPNSDLKGNFSLDSSGHIKNYDTNVNEKVVVNDLTYNSDTKYTNNGIKNNYTFLIKNTNTDASNSTKYRTEKDHKLASIFSYNASYPLQKTNDKYINFLKPMISFRYSPQRTYGMKNSENKINADNVFNLNRIMNNETIEEGASLTYGTEYQKTNKNKNNLFKAKIANILRVEDSENLPTGYELNDKISNIFGSFSFDTNKNFMTSYNYSLDSNLSETSYQSLTTEFKVNNFVTSFEYINENNTLKNNSFLSNKSTYNFDETKNLSFATRKNKETKATEFYNLMYQYRNDCLIAAIEYNKDYYDDQDLRPEENIFFKLTIIPFGETKSPNLK